MVFVAKAFLILVLLSILHLLLWRSFKQKTVVCNMLFNNSWQDSRIPVSPDINNSLHGFDDLGKHHFPQDVLQEIRSIKLDNANASHGLAFVGIFCTAGDFIQRDLVRHTSNLLAPPGLALRFVICQPLSASSNPILEAESQLHGDIVFLDCVENMDKGKSLQFFQVVRQTFPNYHFYAKTDLDSYNLYFNVAYALDQAPKCGLYMGQRYYHEGVHYHVGHMYILSTDLVARLESCGDKCPDVIDFEDRSIGKFLNRLVGKENLQWADWGLRHVVYGADGTLLGHAKRNGPLVKELFTPWLVLLHGMKSHNWIEGHTYVREVITVDTIRAAKYEKFAD